MTDRADTIALPIEATALTPYPVSSPPPPLAISTPPSYLGGGFAVVIGPPVVLGNTPTLYAASSSFVTEVAGGETVIAAMVYAGAGADTITVDPESKALVAAGTGFLEVFGGAGSTTVVGGSGGGVFIGGSGGPNTLVGGNAATTLIGGGNGDALFGGTGNLMVSGSGTQVAALGANDTLYTAAALGDFDLVVGNGSVGTGGLIGLGAGTASLTGLDQATVFGGAGAATVEGSGLQVWGGAGSLVVALTSAANIHATGSTVSGGAGSLTVNGGAAENLLIGGAAGDNLMLAELSSTVIGGGNGDQILIDRTLSFGGNLLVAGAGRETISDAMSSSGSSVLGYGANTIYGGTGQDSVNLYDSDERFFGGAGSATVNIGRNSGMNEILGGQGRLTVLDAGQGANLVVGGQAGGNLLTGAGSSDVLVGVADGDRLDYQGAFNGLLVAGVGNETLTADPGIFAKPTLVAGAGNDLMIRTGQREPEAGMGSVPVTQFVFFDGHAGGADTIQGFMPGVDLIALGGYGTDAATQTAAKQTDIGGNTNLMLSDGTHIVIMGVASVAAGAIVGF
jgi:Ca2+-binding RTX toxin-like protein